MIRILFFVLLALSTISSPALAQLGSGGISLFPRPAPMWGEHADGGEIPVAVGATTLLGLMIYDVVDAPRSARSYTDRRGGSDRRSPRRAILLSAGATVVPLVVGAVAFDRGAEGLGLAMGAAGVVLGPSTGHWYAENRRRAVRNAGIRAVLLLGTAYLESCCT